MSVASAFPMAKKSKPSSGGDPTPKTTVKVPSDLHRKLRTVAAYNGEGIEDYLDRVLRPIVDRDFALMGKEIQEG